MIIIPYPDKAKAKTKFVREYGLNSIYSGKHWRKRNDDKDYWRLLMRSELNRQGIKPNVFDKPVHISFYWDDGLDLDNSAYMRKLIIDCLKGVLLADDDKRYVRGLSDAIWNGNGIKVEVREVKVNRV